MPALSAAESFITFATNTPGSYFIWSWSAISGVIVVTSTPRNGHSTLPFFKILSITFLQVLADTAKPNPCAFSYIIVLIPMTFPSNETSGPPLLPGLIAASV